MWSPRFMAMCLSAVLLAGCGGVGTYVRGLSPQQKSQARALPVHRETLEDGSYRFVQRVEGLSCQVNAVDDFKATEEEALDELRYAALKAGATAVMEVACVRESFRESAYNCFDSIVCRGVGIVLRSKP